MRLSLSFVHQEDGEKFKVQQWSIEGEVKKESDNANPKGEWNLNVEAISFEGCRPYEDSLLHRIRGHFDATNNETTKSKEKGKVLDKLKMTRVGEWL